MFFGVLCVESHAFQKGRFPGIALGVRRGAAAGGAVGVRRAPPGRRGHRLRREGGDPAGASIENRDRAYPGKQQKNCDSNIAARF